MKLRFTTLILLFQLTYLAQQDSISIMLRDSINNQIIINTNQFKNENPATVGMFNKNRILTNHRFNLFDFTIYTSLYAFDKSLGKKNNWSIGIFHKRENYNNSFSFRYSGISASRKLNFKKHRLTIGISGELLICAFNWNTASFGDMIDPRIGFIYQSNDVPRGGTASNLDWNLGLTHAYKYFRLGASALHINEPALSITKGGYSLPITFNTNVSYTFNSSLFQLTPIINATQNGLYFSQNISLLAIYRNKYFFLGDIKTTEWKHIKSYTIKAGLITNNRLNANIGYSITPRLLDNSHTFYVSLAYIFSTKKSKS